MVSILRAGSAGLPLVLAAALGLGALTARADDSVDPWTYAYAGMDHFYNLEYDEALAEFQLAGEADPGNPFFYNFVANTYLFQELYRLGKLEGNLYDASNAFLKDKKPEPDRERISKVEKNIARAREICEARLEKNPRDKEALYVLGATYGIEGNLKFTIEKSWFGALRAGSKANDLHQEVLGLDPEYHDAKLIPGVYQYAVGSIPRSVKWLAFLAGYSGSRQRGVELLHQAMLHGKLTSSDATFLLAIIYTREKRHSDARKLLKNRAAFYPRNPLLPMEVARTFTREGKHTDALEHYLRVANDMEAGKPGYDKLPRERVWYQVGVLLQRQAKYEEALQAFARAMDDPEGDGLVKAHSGLRRGEILLVQNRPDEARAEYRRVASMPFEETRRQAEERLRNLK